VELRDVHFRFASSVDVGGAEGLSFRVPAGKIVALAGPADGGKLCVPSLLLRFYDPAQGRVLVDDKDVAAFDPRYLREQIATVGHDPVIFNSSVRLNFPNFYLFTPRP
jgi:ABC-type multidrug transport system fused ATPase/permease subunit